jgi:Spy/CpxP family protein refolding chaperone
MQSQGDDRRTKMMALRTDTNTKINAVLTASQKTEFAKMQEEMAARRPGGGGPPQ